MEANWAFEFFGKPKKRATELCRRIEGRFGTSLEESTEAGLGARDPSGVWREGEDCFVSSIVLLELVLLFS